MKTIRSVLIFLAALMAQSAAGQSTQPRLAKPDEQGRNLYIIELDHDVVERADVRNEAPTRSSMDRENATDFRGWHRPQARATIKALEAEYSIQARTMTSYILPSFSAYVSEAVVERLKADPRVTAVLPTYSSTKYASWSDQLSGGEIIPWGKTAIGTNDAASATNRVYMLDGGPMPANNDLNSITIAQVNLNIEPDNPAHAVHVAGILAAQMNSAQSRGINPSAAVTAIRKGDTDDLTRMAMDWVLLDAESNGVYGVFNFSSTFNAIDPAAFKKFFRRMSNRVLVVQSAGNARDNACQFAYGPASPVDGILVVGAMDKDGKQAIPMDNGSYGYEAGSNVGPCVEVWAPGHDVYSTWNTGPSATRVLSGTSMAARTSRRLPQDLERSERRPSSVSITSALGSPLLVTTRKTMPQLSFHRSFSPRRSQFQLAFAT